MITSLIEFLFSIHRAMELETVMAGHRGLLGFMWGVREFELYEGRSCRITELYVESQAIGVLFSEGLTALQDFTWKPT